MGKNTLSIAPGVVIEHVGDDVLVVIPGSSDVMRISGDQATALRIIESGNESGLSRKAVEGLVKVGVVVNRGEVTRRSLVKAGAIGAGAGIAVMALPSAAAASSMGPPLRPQLPGNLMADDWNAQGEVDFPEIDDLLDPDFGDWIVLIEVLGAPYDVNDPPALEANVSSGSSNYTANLLRLDTALNGAYWVFKGTSVTPTSGFPARGDDFSLIFTFGNVSYEVTPGSPAQ
jgi:hypothetical protein